MVKRTNIGRIALVGAGPGDPELITLKGLRILEEANTILFDALIPPELLDINSSARKIYVGKRAGNHAMEQTEINQLLVDLARQGELVVRLKGGDPMVFGRATEELDFAKSHGIPIEIIPGISAYAGIAATHHIPITQRGVSDGIWITNGTTHAGTISEDIALAARSSATVVVYMGLSRLPEILEVFKLYKQEDYPVAIIQNGTLPHERSVFGNIGNIAKQAQEAHIGTPALLLFGHAVSRKDIVEPVFLAQIQNEFVNA